MDGRSGDDPEKEPGRKGGDERWHRDVGHLPAVLAAATCRHRAGSRLRAGQGLPRRGLLRRGHHHLGRRSRAAGPGPRAGRAPHDLLFSTPAPGYLDKTSATTVHAALGLDRAVPPTTSAARPRSALGTLLMALQGAATRRSLAVVSDLRTGLAGGAEERDAG